MKTLGRLLLMIVALPFVAGCGKSQSAPSALQSETKTVTQPTIDLSVAITIGNHTYIPLNIFNSPQNCIQEILTILNTFEKAHVELRVTNWHIEKQQKALNAVEYIYGLWIDHEPKRN